MSLRTLVLGGSGQLGREVVAQARQARGPVLGLAHHQCEITHREAIAYWLESFRPELVINCAAYTKVDDCEHNPATAHAVNELGPMLLAQACEKAGIRLVHVSTDYVFDGQGNTPYREDSTTAPRSVYGESKLAGEGRVLAYGRTLVVRTSWLFGPGGPNFVATIRRLLAKGEPLRVVSDQVGCPTYAPFLARALWQLVERGATGVVHFANREPTSWHGLATAIAAAEAPQVSVEAVSSDEFPRPARRPAYSVLDVTKAQTLLGRTVEPWAWGLAEYLDRLRSEAQFRRGNTFRGGTP